MKKFLVVILGLCFCLGILTACGDGESTEANSNEDSAAVQEAESDLAEKYNLETDKILIVTDYDVTKFEPQKNQEIEITDPAEIKKFQESVKFDNWKSYGSERPAAMFSQIVIFNDTLAMRFYEDLENCFIGSYEITEDGLYKFVAADKDDLYVVSPEFTEMLKSYVEQLN